MKQEIKWQKPTKENLEIGKVDSKDILLLKCSTIHEGKIIEHIFKAKYSKYSIANPTRIWCRLTFGGNYKALPGHVKVNAFAVLVKDEEGAH